MMWFIFSTKRGVLIFLCKWNFECSVLTGNNHVRQKWKDFDYERKNIAVTNSSSLEIWNGWLLKMPRLFDGRLEGKIVDVYKITKFKNSFYRHINQFENTFPNECKQKWYHLMMKLNLYRLLSVGYYEIHICISNIIVWFQTELMWNNLVV